MKNLEMFCISLEPNHYNFIKELGYVPVGLGNKNFEEGWFKDKSGTNISEKNKNYGEYTYHYWIWKNYLDKLGNNWIGFCQYRMFWSLKNFKNEDVNFSSLNSQVLKEIPDLKKSSGVLLQKIKDGHLIHVGTFENKEDTQ